MQLEPGYKVLRRVGSKGYTSVAMYSGSLFYSRGKIVRPKPGCGPLAVFTDLEYAKRLILWHIHTPERYLAIARIKFQRSKEEMVYYRGRFETFYANLADLPAGTVLADAVHVISYLTAKEKKELLEG